MDMLKSSEKYLVIELGVLMFTLQNTVTFPVCIQPTRTDSIAMLQLGHPFSLGVFSSVVISRPAGSFWLPRCQRFNQRPLAGKVR